MPGRQGSRGGDARRGSAERDFRACTCVRHAQRERESIFVSHAKIYFYVPTHAVSVSAIQAVLLKDLVGIFEHGLQITTESRTRPVVSVMLQAIIRPNASIA